MTNGCQIGSEDKLSHLQLKVDSVKRHSHGGLRFLCLSYWVQGPATLHAVVLVIFNPDLVDRGDVTGSPGVIIVRGVSDKAQLEGDLASCPQFGQDNKNRKVSQLASVVRTLLAANGKVKEPGHLHHIGPVVGVEEHLARLALLF